LTNKNKVINSQDVDEELIWKCMKTLYICIVRNIDKCSREELTALMQKRNVNPGKRHTL
jgi:hypothetical protein